MRAFCLSFFLLVLLLTFPHSAHAQSTTPAQTSGTIDVEARVGEFTLTISGFASPFASVVLNSDGQTLGTTTADSSGRFSFANLLVKRGFSSFCLTSIDFKRLGESEGCLSITPVYQSSTVSNVFIPPTIGAFRKRIRVGDEGIVWGYTIPRSSVTLMLKGGKRIALTSDDEGFYEYREKFGAGKYRFTSSAIYQDIPSLPPTKSVEIETVTTAQEVAERIKETGRKLTELFSSIWFWLLLLLLLIIITTILLRLFPRLLPAIFDKLKRHHPLHHDWLLSFIRKKEKK